MDSLELIKLGDVLAHRALRHVQPGGRAGEVALLDATEGGPLVQVALQGFGVVYLPALLVQPHIDHGELQPVLEGYSRKDMWLYAA